MEKRHTLIKKMERVFSVVMIAALLFLLYNFYDNYRFKHLPLAKDIQVKIEQKRAEIEQKIWDHYQMAFNIPLILSDKMPANLYGAAVKEQDGSIKIYINKKRIKESLSYILEDVIAHEYAHALMFKKGYASTRDGHDERWQEICLNLGGSRCDRFVNHNDIVLNKIGF